jgi:hypothetical protein
MWDSPNSRERCDGWCVVILAFAVVCLIAIVRGVN